MRRTTTGVRPLVLSAVLWTVAGSVLAACSSSGPGTAGPRSTPSVSPTASPSPSPTVSPTPSLPPYARSAVAVAETPSEVVPGFGSVWVVCHRSAEVDRVDPRTGRIVAQVTTSGGELVSGTAAAGHLWYVSAATKSVEGIDPATNRVTVRVPVDSDGGGVTGDARGVWFAGTSGAVLRLSASGKVLARRAIAPAGAGLSPLLVGSRLWVADPDHETVYRLDPSTLAVQGKQALKGDVGNLLAAFGSLWVGAFSGPLYRLDPVTGAVRATFPVQAVDHLAAGPKLLWVRVSDTQLDGVDPATGKTVRSFTTLPTSEVPGGGVLWQRGELWVVNWTEGDVWRIPSAA